MAIVVAAIGASGSVFGFLQFMIDKKEKKKADKLQEIQNSIAELKTDLENNNKLTIAIGRDRINHLCNQFMDLGYIPKKDYVSFKLIGEAYVNDNKQNTEVKTKFEWCIENLQVK